MKMMYQNVEFIGSDGQLRLSGVSKEHKQNNLDKEGGWPYETDNN